MKTALRNIVKCGKISLKIVHFMALFQSEPKQAVSSPHNGRRGAWKSFLAPEACC